MTNSVDLDEVAQNEPPHQDLRCLKIQLFLSEEAGPRSAIGKASDL